MVRARADRICRIGLCSAWIGEGRNILRPGVDANVGLKSESAARVHRRITDLDRESLRIGLAVERISDGNCYGVSALFGIVVVIARQRFWAAHIKVSVRRSVAPVYIDSPRAAVRITERAKVKQL